jgi:DNA-binding transcriptional regulator YdaS (Cro superfamily)
MAKPKPTQRATQRAIDVLGGPVNAARRLHMKRYQAVQSWVRHQVPVEHCPAIERETRAAGSVVTCEELRPDVPWAVLREQVAA